MEPRVIDLLLDNKHELVVLNGDLQLATDKQGIAQRIKTKMQLFKEEFFLDEEDGTPWFQNILVKNPSIAEVREIFRELLDSTPGVLEILSLDISNQGDRNIDIDWNVNTDLGELAGNVTNPVAQDEG